MEGASGQKLAYLEVARVVCILFVVAAHATDVTAARTGPTSLIVFLSTAIRFVVPAFFMVSGFLIGVHHRDPGYRLSARSFWRRRALTIVVPFFVWSVVYTHMFTIAAYGGSLFAGETLFGLATGPMHLYFVAVLLQFLIVYSILARWFSARLLAVCLALAAVGSVVFYAVSDRLLWSAGPDGHFFEWHWGKLCVAWAVFFVWGIWLGYRPGAMEWLRRYRWWLVLAAVVAFVPYWLEMHRQVAHFGAFSRDYFLLAGLPYQFLGACALLAVLYEWERLYRRSAPGRTVVAWGALMFGVYVAHLAVVHELDPVLQRLWPAAPALVEIAVLTLTGFFVTLALVWLCGTRYLWPLGVAFFGGRGQRTPRRPPPGPPPGPPAGEGEAEAGKAGSGSALGG